MSDISLTIALAAFAVNVMGLAIVISLNRIARVLERIADK